MQRDATYIAQTIEAAINGDVEAAEEVLALFRSAVDHRLIDGVAPEYRRIAEYIAECFWTYDQGATIAHALRMERPRKVGQPKGNRKVNEDSYAALMVLLDRSLGSAGKAKGKIIELEQPAGGNAKDKKSNRAPVSPRTLDTIYASYVGARALSHDDLIVMLSPAHRKLFKKTLR